MTSRSSPEKSSTPPSVIPGSAKWSHYQGSSIFGDYTVNATNDAFDEGRRYLPGVAHLDPDPADPTILNPEFVHGDQVRSTRALTDDTGAFTREVIYTSFGEPVSTTGASDTRYGFVGASGYEEALIPGWSFAHVGARWYDPSTGRFLQRDPIGIRGGLNVYAYAQNNPLASIDPDGRIRIGAPKPTGSSDEGMFDPFWTKVHYCAGYAAGASGVSLPETIYLAIRWELWEPDNWPRWKESDANRVGDIIVAGIGWIDAVILEPLTDEYHKAYP